MSCGLKKKNRIERLKINIVDGLARRAFHLPGFVHSSFAVLVHLRFSNTSHPTQATEGTLFLEVESNSHVGFCFSLFNGIASYSFGTEIFQDSSLGKICHVQNFINQDINISTELHRSAVKSGIQHGEIGSHFSSRQPAKRLLRYL